VGVSAVEAAASAERGKGIMELARFGDKHSK
jgi:hypothetical protein